MAATGLPIHPSSMSLRQVWMPPPRNVSGAQPTRTPLALAISSIFLPSSRVTARGFSLWMLLPASMAAKATLACALGIVRFTTISMSGSASSSSTLIGLTPNSSPLALARSGSMSAQPTTSKIWNALHRLK